MTLTVTADDPFTTLNRLNTVPITTVDNTHQAIPINKFFSSSPWTVQKEECFYDEKTAVLIKSCHSSTRLMKVVLTVSLVSTPILYGIKFSLIAVVAFEFFVISVLAIHLWAITDQRDQSLGKHVESIVKELAALRKKGFEILASKNPASKEMQDLINIQTDLDARSELMIQNFESRCSMDEDKKSEFLFELKKNSEFVTKMKSLLLLFNEEDPTQGEEEKKIVASLQKLCKKIDHDLSKKISAIFSKKIEKIEKKFQSTFKNGLSLEKVKSEILHLLKNLSTILQFLELFNISAEAENIHISELKQKHLFLEFNKKYLDDAKTLLEFLASFDAQKIPEDVLAVSDELLMMCQNKASSFDEETWRLSSDSLTPVNCSRLDKMSLLRHCCLFNPESIIPDEFWKSAFPESFIALNLFLKNNPNHHEAKSIKLLLNQFNNLEISPVYFCHHAKDFLDVNKPFSKLEIWKFGYYYRARVLSKKNSGLSIDKPRVRITAEGEIRRS